MKYYTTIFSLLFLCSILVSLLICFGKLTNNIEKDIKNSITKINNLKEQIKINELEYTLHTNTNYLLELKKIYLIDNIEIQAILFAFHLKYQHIFLICINF